MAHYSEKKRLILRRREEGETIETPALNAMFLLNNPDDVADEISIQGIRAAADLMVLIQHLFVLDATDKKMLAMQFKNIGKIADAGAAIQYLSYQREYAQLAKVRESVTQALA